MRIEKLFAAYGLWKFQKQEHKSKKAKRQASKQEQEARALCH
jgi:hypothetical protein